MATGPSERATPTVSRRARRMLDAPRRAGDAREAVLMDVARTLVQAGEFQETSIGEIAKRAGISRQSFYFYYQSKDELLAHLVTETLYESQPWRETLYANWDTTDPARAMRGLVDDTVAMWRKHRAVLCAAVEIGPRSDPVLDQWAGVVEETAEFIVDLIVASTKIESLRDPEVARRTMISLIWQIERNCFMHVFRGSDESDEELAERIGDLWLRQLGLT